MGSQGLTEQESMCSSLLQALSEHRDSPLGPLSGETVKGMDFSSHKIGVEEP